MAHLPILPVFAAMPERMSLGQSIAFQLNGLIVVGVALASIWLLLELIGRFFQRSAAAAPAAAAAVPVTPSPAAPAAPVEAGPRPEIVAAITAAIHVALGARARITAIVPVPDTPWAHEGRRQIFSSHQPR